MVAVKLVLGDVGELVSEFLVDLRRQSLHAWEYT